jgi:hypothetical protein
LWVVLLTAVVLVQSTALSFQKGVDGFDPDADAKQPDAEDISPRIG